MRNSKNYQRALAELRDRHRAEFDDINRETGGKRRNWLGEDACGTNAGYMRHSRRHEPACQPCKDARAAEARRQRAEQKIRAIR